jgi:DNA-binding MurR/RpiR family transcriptional regulator
MRIISMKNTTFIERIRRLDKLTPAETKISSYFESNYPFTAFETITSLSQKVGVSKASIGRFLSRLGYRGFPEFMQEMRNVVVSRLESPIERYTGRRAQIKAKKIDFLGQHMDMTLRNLEETNLRMDPVQLRKAASVIASCKGNLYVLGTATSQALAMYFFLLTKYMRQQVILLDANFSTIRHQLVDVDPQDVLLTITHYRFSKHTAKMAHWFAAQKCRVIVIADRENNPMSDVADFQFFARSEGPPLFNSRIAALMILESLLMAMAPILESQMYQRFEMFEELREVFDTHPPWPSGTPHDLMNSGKEI